MIQLTREIRFSLATSHETRPVTNSWAGWPSTNRIVPFLVLTCTVKGEPDKNTGYVCNIKLLDKLLRDIITDGSVPNYDGTQTAEQMIATVFERAIANWRHDANITQLRLATSPYQHFTINSADPKMICMTQQFEFSASHRLHCAELSPSENQRQFGKCNNPNGHGHNYVVEVTIARQVDDETGQVIGLGEFEATIKRLVVDRLDHKYLNKDVEYFRDVIPSVENITIAIWNWLDGELDPARLTNIRVYETPKTWAEYRGE